MQTFPKNYEFDKKLGKTVVARQIGNAVPPLFAKIIGKELIKNFNKNYNKINFKEQLV